LVGQDEGHPVCKKLGVGFFSGDDFVELCTPPVVTITSIIQQ